MGTDETDFATNMLVVGVVHATSEDRPARLAPLGKSLNSRTGKNRLLPWCNTLAIGA
jgi:hypothetical protein